MKKILFVMLNLLILTFALNAAEVNGTVVDTNFEGQSDITVKLSGWHQNNEVEVTTETNEDGEFQFNDIQVGFYIVIAENGEDFPPFTHVNIMEEDQVIEDLQIILPSGTDPPTGEGVISGSVSNEDGEPIQDAIVEARKFYNHGAQPLTAETDEEGNFTFENLTLGQYRIIVRHDDFYPAHYPGWNSEETLELSEDNQTVTGIEIQMIANGWNPPQEGEGVISGVILNENNEPLVDVIVAAQPEGNGNNGHHGHGHGFDNFSVETDDEGNFEIENLPIGNYRLFAMSCDYQPVQYPEMGENPLSITEEVTEINNIEIIMNNDIPQPPQGEGTISGVVKDENGEVVTEAHVRLEGEGWGQHHTAFTAEDGTFIFENISLGEYVLVASKGNWHNGFLVSEEIEVELTEENNSIENIELVVLGDDPNLPEGTVSGVVKDEDGEVVAEAHVRLEGEEWGQHYFAFTAEDGTFIFENVSAGEYVLVASKGNWHNGFLVSEEMEIELTDDNNNIENIELVLVRENQNLPEGRITGSLIDNENNPLMRQVTLVSSENCLHYTTWSDDEGNFEFENVANGTYELFTRIHWEEYFYMVDGEVAELVISDEIQSLEDIQFVVDFEEEEGNSSITLNILQEIAGNAHYVIHAEYGHLTRSGEFTEQNATINNLPEGAYFIQVMMEGYENWYYDNTNDFDEIEMYQLGAEDSAYINVDFEGFEIVSYTISGNIKNSNNEPIENAVISVNPEGCFGGGNHGNGWEDFSTETDAEGNYEITLPEGEYSLMAHAQGYIMQFWPGVIGYHNQEFVELDEDLDNMNFTLSTTYEENFNISGIVTIEGNTPEEGQHVLIVAVSSEEDDADVYTESTLCGDNGSYELVLDQPGNYYVLAITSGTIPEFYNDSYDWSEADLVSVTAAGVSELNFDLTMPQSEGIENVAGTVTDINGDVVASATVLMYNENNIPVAFATTNQNGQYNIAFLAAEDYTLKATKMYYEAFQTTVNPGQESVVDPVINPTTTDNEIVEIPTTSAISNYPNPFNPETNIRFAITEKSNVNVSIYNVKGQKVKTLVNETMDAGNHSVVWKGSNNKNQSVSSGVYFMRLSTPKEVISKKINLLK
jgi:flagellar hook assembly protein FlgD